MRTTFAYLFLCGVVLAAIVHIAIVLLVPKVGEKEIAGKLLTQTAVNRFVQHKENSDSLLSDSDPFFRLATCQFDLAEKAVMVEAQETGIYWSSAVFNDQGRVVYSFNTASAIGNRLKMIVVNPVQLAQLRQFQPEELETSVIVETRQEKGFVIVRVLQADDSYEPDVTGFIEGLDCKPFETQESVGGS